jgi:chloramphenicol 3-O-phosphotransferase
MLVVETAGDTRASPLSGLLILTGASHTGKTSVARAILDLAPQPVALLGVDRVIQDTLARPSGNPWREIPLAYELLRPQVEILLGRGWFVLLESTFTFIPDDGDPEMHLDQLRLLLKAAYQLSAPAMVVQLAPDRQTTIDRAVRTGRLPPGLVTKTLDLHEKAELPTGTLKFETAESSPEELAREILVRISAG